MLSICVENYELKILSRKFGVILNKNKKLGPASSVVERSLRKIFVRGDRGSIPAAGGLFNRDKINS